MVMTTLISIITATLFLVVASLILSILLIIAEKKILNYGICKISVNKGDKELEVEGGSSLLSSLGSNDIFIPSACGGRGSCAYCKLKVTEGGGMISPVETPYLSDEEIKQKIRLSCQVKVRNDIFVEIPKELFNVKKFKGILEHKKELTYDILELRIKLIEPKSIDFQAGQYVQLESKEYKGRDSVMRAYSISSPPSDHNYVELNVRLVPDGICTTWVFDYLKEKDELYFSGPYGDFVLSETDLSVIFMAGGSGMAPIYSLIHYMIENNINRNATYFFGARTQKDLFYVDELKKLEEEHSWLTFVPVLSAEPEDSGWKGERGLVTDALDRHFKECSEYEAYLCGSPGMVNACEKKLISKGIKEGAIFYDKFA